MYQVRAKREVILAAGAIHSLQVLQLSGIEPKSLLQSAGVTLNLSSLVFHCNHQYERLVNWTSIL
jgi:choline dehydrogenase-like flavoprotein